MNFIVIYSRTFLEKVSDWTDALKNMAIRAAEHAAQNPNLTDYVRPYLTPIKQKHPPTDRQYTLYFEIVSANEIYIIWINDPSCLHDTRANFDDPCYKEFKRLQDKGRLERFDPDFHKLKFHVRPNRQKIVMCRSHYLGKEVLLNTGDDGSGTLVGYAFSCSETHTDIAVIHIGQFLERLHNELAQNQTRTPFQIQFTKNGFQREIELLTSGHDPAKWQIVDDQEDFILRKI